MIQGSRVLWLCRTWFEARIGYCGCAEHDSKARIGIGSYAGHALRLGRELENIIQSNRVMWLCKSCLEVKIVVSGYAGHVSRLGWGSGM